MPRRYEMGARVAAKERTRTAILDAAERLLIGRYYDEVTLADVAREAGVSQQTIVNHFGSKLELYLASFADRFVPVVTGLREATVAGDLDSAVDTVLRDYERFGDTTVRTLSLAGRVPELDPVLAEGHRFHRDWVERVFRPLLTGRRGAARERRVTLLAIALDVRTWHQLRRESGLGVEETRRHLTDLCRAVLAA